MPRVTQSYRDRQVARILAAAEICFARRGFDGASMDEIIAEVGMSSSTVYRYFPEGKRSLVRAVLSRATDPIVEWAKELADAEELPTLEEAFMGGVERSWVLKTRLSDGVDEATRSAGGGSEPVLDAGRIELVVSIWAELVRQPDLREASAGRHSRVRAEIAHVVRRWQGEGVIAREIDPDEAAAIVHNAAMGLVVEWLITGEYGRRDAAMTASAVARLLGARSGGPHHYSGGSASERGDP